MTRGHPELLKEFLGTELEQTHTVCWKWSVFRHMVLLCTELYPVTVLC